jgi:hypothetical protein
MAEPERRAGGGLYRDVAGSRDRASGPGRGGDERVVFGGAQWGEPSGGEVGRGPDAPQARAAATVPSVHESAATSTCTGMLTERTACCNALRHEGSSVSSL